MNVGTLYELLMGAENKGAKAIATIGDRSIRLARQNYVEDDVYYILAAHPNEETATIQDVIDGMVNESEYECWLRHEGIQTYNRFQDIPVQICTKNDMEDEDAEYLDISFVGHMGSNTVIDCTAEKKFRVKIIQTWEHNDGTMHFENEYIEVCEME